MDDRWNSSKKEKAMTQQPKLELRYVTLRVGSKLVEPQSGNSYVVENWDDQCIYYTDGTYGDLGWLDYRIAPASNPEASQDVALLLVDDNS